MLIDQSLRVILTNGRRGPEALFLQGNPGSSSSTPVAPWDGFTVESYMDVNYPTRTTAGYEFELRDFFRVHPLFVVKAFDRHERAFPFPAAHCTNGEDDGGRGHDGTTADGSGSPASPSPQKGDQHQNGQGEQGTLVPGGALPPVRRDTAAAGWSAGLLSAKHIVIAVGGLLMILGMPAVAWLRRRRSAE
ncbi:hypothetical protein [Streptomyces sp. NPDC052107]|uniref:hypothetical protein n=1 Tax=Streptomyces sp. NPDC052107 TaxID=3155632 RepID=UPI003432DE2C